MIPLPLEIVDSLSVRIFAFLQSLSGTYKNITVLTQQSIIVCLMSRQFVIRIKDGEIQYFVCWFKIKPEEVEGMKERVRPVDIYSGSYMYVVEAGNKMGKRGMAEMVKKIRAKAEGMQGVFWHRPAKADKVFDFPSQKGGIYGRE